MTSGNLPRYLLYTAAFLVFTLLFSLYGFPGDRLTNMVNARLKAVAGDGLRVRDVSPAFPWSLKVSGLTAPFSGSTLSFGNAILSPDVGAYLAGKKGARIRLSGGPVTGNLSLRSPETGMTLRFSPVKVDLAALSEIFSFPVRLEGSATLDVALETGDPAGSVWNGKGSVLAGDIVILGDILDALGISPLRLQKLKASAVLENNVLTLGENDVSGDIGLNARGTVRFVPSRPESSRLDLVLELRPGPGVRERIVPLPGMLGGKPRGDGSVEIRLRGTVGRPVLTS